MWVVGLHLRVMVKAKEIDYDGGTDISKCTIREISEAVG